MRALVHEDISRSPQILWEHLRTFLGLSEYEARIYEFLVSQGPSTARKISVKCGVPRTKVYCVLRRLIEQNMIAELPLNPKLFIALPPSDALKPIIDAHEKIVKSLNEAFLSLQRRYEESTKPELIREEAWILVGNKALKGVVDLLSGAEKHVEFFSSWEFFLQIYGLLNRVLDDLLERGVSVYLYVSSSSKIDKKVCHNMGLHYKVIRGSLPAFIMLIDDKYIVLHPMEDGNDLSSKDEWIIIHNKKLLNIFIKILLYFKEKRAYSNNS